VREDSISPPAPADQRGEVRQTGQQVDNAEPGHGSANVVVSDEGLDEGRRTREVVALPQAGPRDEDQQEPDLDEVGDEEQTG
jgi:hypothetical protein